jgi:hypothetical protein
MELSQVGPSSTSLTVGEISQYVAKLEPAKDWFTVKPFFFFNLRKPHSLQKMYFVDPGEEVKSRLFQALTRDAHPDSNSRPAVQISNSLLAKDWFTVKRVSDEMIANFFWFFFFLIFLVFNFNFICCLSLIFYVILLKLFLFSIYPSD